MYAPYLAVHSVNSLTNIPCIHRVCMVLANPTNRHKTNWRVEHGRCKLSALHTPTHPHIYLHTHAHIHT
jgi:hypothetical protein